MDSKRLEAVLADYNPWWKAGDWDADLPDYRRPIVAEVLSDLKDLPQIISVTGPRRVGKSTALRHVISHLIREEGIDPQRVVYFSLDDPEVFTSPDAQRVVLDLLFDAFARPGNVTFVFLDEIQRLPRWELFLKKAYDLKRPFRFVVSGSASSPIFRSSQESLLGRIKDRHLLPFSFREYCEYRLRGRAEFAATLASHRTLKMAMLASDGETAVQCTREVDFVFTHGGARHLPIEVKHRKTVDQIGGVRSFMGKYRLSFGCIITRDQTPSFQNNILSLPLRYFLLAT